MRKNTTKPKIQIREKSTPHPRSPELKFRVAMEALCNKKSLQEVAREFGVVSSQVFNWKKTILEHGKDLFISSDDTPSSNTSNPVPQLNKLYAQIGRLAAENERLAQLVGKNRVDSL